MPSESGATIATLYPAAATRHATASPEGPAPAITRSYSCPSSGGSLPSRSGNHCSSCGLGGASRVPLLSEAGAAGASAGLFFIPRRTALCRVCMHRFGVDKATMRGEPRNAGDMSRFESNDVLTRVAGTCSPAHFLGQLGTNRCTHQCRGGSYNDIWTGWVLTSTDVLAPLP